MIPNDFIQTLLGRVDIVEVVDRHVPLKKAGANYQACCPFHSEKTPSFTVSPTMQFYHCFGCGAHGTAIGFLMEHAGKSFPEAVDDVDDVDAREQRLDEVGGNHRVRKGEPAGRPDEARPTMGAPVPGSGHRATGFRAGRGRSHTAGKRPSINRPAAPRAPFRPVLDVRSGP